MYDERKVRIQERLSTNVFRFQIQAAASNKGAPGAAANGTDDQLNSDDKSHMYWAKGTGFGTGSTQQSWNVEQALLRQKSEEEHVTVLLQVSCRTIASGNHRA